MLVLSWVFNYFSLFWCLPHFLQKKQEVDDIIQEIRDQYFTLVDEKNDGAYLGIQVERERDELLKITQSFLIKRILSSLGNAIINKNRKRTPAKHSYLLHKNEEGSERK